MRGLTKRKTQRERQVAISIMSQKTAGKANFLYRLQNMILPITWLKD